MSLLNFLAPGSMCYRIFMLGVTYGAAIFALLVSQQSGYCQQSRNTGKQREHLTVTATAYRAIPHQNSFDVNLPGRIDTDCYGSGAGWSYSISCSSYVTPPVDIPIDLSWVEIYNAVVADGKVYTIRCGAHWAGSSCSWLTPGQSFEAEVHGDTMNVTAYFPGGRRIRPKFKIVDVTEYQSSLPSQQTMTSLPTPPPLNEALAPIRSDDPSIERDIEPFVNKTSTLTNDAIVRLKKKGASDSFLIHEISQMPRSSIAFSVSREDILLLQGMGLSDGLILAMVKASKP